MGNVLTCWLHIISHDWASRNLRAAGQHLLSRNLVGSHVLCDGPDRYNPLHEARPCLYFRLEHRGIASEAYGENGHSIQPRQTLGDWRAPSSNQYYFKSE